MVARTPASRKAKGRRFQQWVRDKLIALRKDFKPEDIRSTSMGVTGEDIQLSTYVRGLLPIQVECKNMEGKRLPVQDFMDQARAHGSHEPVVFVKQNHKKPLVIIEAEHYLDLQRERLNG